MRRVHRVNWKATTVLALTAVLIVPLLVFGGPAFARSGDAASSQYEYPSADQYKVTICHHTHSRKHPWVQITIDQSALQAHLQHGDTVPPCPIVSSTKHAKKHSVKHSTKHSTRHSKNHSSHGKRR